MRMPVELFRQSGKIVLIECGQLVLAMINKHNFHCVRDQLVKGLDPFCHGSFAGLGLRDGDLLDRRLQDGACAFKAFEMAWMVQQFKRRDTPSCQAVAQ